MKQNLIKMMMMTSSKINNNNIKVKNAFNKDNNQTHPLKIKS